MEENRNRINQPGAGNRPFKDNMKTKTELLNWLAEEIEKLQREYDGQREATKHFKTPGNPYIASLGTKLMTMKDFKEKLEGME